MSQRCAVCGKEPTFGGKVARLGQNAQRRRILGRSSRMFRPNIQSVKATVDGRPVRLKVCTSCLKAGKVQRRSS
ncbi:MAG: 50S ribosomal protein L28 [Catenulispora sp.]|nr:50S ribosomal protein L28 [Catenulispora sp.]